MKLIENVPDYNWTCSNLYQLDVFDRKEKYDYDWTNEYYYMRKK